VAACRTAQSALRRGSDFGTAGGLTASPTGEQKAMTKERYWVVGGVYRDMAFSALRDGVPQAMGPFETRDEATAVWRKVSQETKGATARFSIAAERLVLPA
jgi:hypothetical protein